MTEYYELLLPGEYYHIYNRAVGNEKLFLNSENYTFFLKKCDKYLPLISDTFCYCLLPNHFHLFLRIKELLDLENSYKMLKGKQISLLDSHFVDQFLVGQFSNLCSSYAKSFNKVYSRKGRLFVDPFSRKIVKSDSHFNTLVFYIHGNAVHHGYCRNLEDWPHSSYLQIVNKQKQFQPQFKVCREEVLNWFGGIDNFKLYHNKADYGNLILSMKKCYCCKKTAKREPADFRNRPDKKNTDLKNPLVLKGASSRRKYFPMLHIFLC